MPKGIPCVSGLGACGRNTTLIFDELGIRTGCYCSLNLSSALSHLSLSLFLPFSLSKRSNLHCVPWENNVFKKIFIFPFPLQPLFFIQRYFGMKWLFIWQYKQGQRVMHFCLSAVRFTPACVLFKYCWNIWSSEIFLPTLLLGGFSVGKPIRGAVNQGSNRGVVVSHWSLTQWNNLHILSTNFNKKQLNVETCLIFLWKQIIECIQHTCYSSDPPPSINRVIAIRFLHASNKNGSLIE